MASDETAAARLLREMRERNSMPKALEDVQKAKSLAAEFQKHFDATSATGGIKIISNLDQNQVEQARKALEVARLTEELTRIKNAENNVTEQARKALDALNLAASAKKIGDLDRVAEQARAALTAWSIKPEDIAKQLQGELTQLRLGHQKPLPADFGIRSVADLGAMIRKARKAMKLTQAEFASHAGVGRRFISELERGKGSIEFDKVMACAHAAGIDVSARNRKT